MPNVRQLNLALQSAGLVDRVITRMRMAFADAAKKDSLVDDFFTRWERRASQNLMEENKTLSDEGVSAALIERRSRSFDNAIADVRQHKSDLLKLGSPRPV